MYKCLIRYFWRCVACVLLLDSMEIRLVFSVFGSLYKIINYEHEILQRSNKWHLSISSATLKYRGKCGV